MTVTYILSLFPTFAFQFQEIISASFFGSSLWPTYGIGQAIIFLACDFYLSIFFFYLFPHLISAVRDWTSTILPHMVWP